MTKFRVKQNPWDSSEGWQPAQKKKKLLGTGAGVENRTSSLSMRQKLENEKKKPRRKANVLNNR